ncbi:hypothetical protein EDB83DRAFT_2414651 [Lactarius deliciosus]|nr:hypothetical protein EDB83DRAFT_2414651 [Lactarius deliciosus]
MSRTAESTFIGQGRNVAVSKFALWLFLLMCRGVIDQAGLHHRSSTLTPVHTLIMASRPRARENRKQTGSGPLALWCARTPNHEVLPSEDLVRF